MKLFLKDGTVVEGESFGAPKSIAGEVVFATGMVGYVESLTDPSFAGQILVCTYPLIGNYGVPNKKYFESENVQIAGLVVSEYSKNYSHHAAERSLSDWLKASGVPGMTGVDTRALTLRLREHGVMLGQLVHAGRSTSLRVKKTLEFTDPNEENLVARVSCKRKRLYGTSGPLVIAIDCGMKENIIRSLVARGTRVLRVPWDYDFSREHYDGFLISNGPGDPAMCRPTVENIRKAMAKSKPILGICLGNQLLALAAGATTYKLTYGHRSQNQPCILRHGSGQVAGRCYITSQNHGFAVDDKKLPSDWEVWFTNANDGSNEGIRHTTKPWRSVQFHPEAAPGPTDTAWIFDEFISELRKRV
jgi:carbamoyl-phosphate synthase small subunit